MVKNNEMSERNKGRELFGKVLANVARDHQQGPWWGGGQGQGKKSSSPVLRAKECAAGQENLPVSSGIERVPLCEANPCR